MVTVHSSRETSKIRKQYLPRHWKYEAIIYTIYDIKKSLPTQPYPDNQVQNAYLPVRFISLFYAYILQTISCPLLHSHPPHPQQMTFFILYRENTSNLSPIILPIQGSQSVSLGYCCAVYTFFFLFLSSESFIFQICSSIYQHHISYKQRAFNECVR